MLATRGCLPFRRVEGNTQSLGWEYVVFCFQRSMNSASNGWSGTGPFGRFALRQTYLATRPSTTHVDHCVSKIDILPLQAQTFRYTESLPAAKSVRVRSGSRRLHTIAYA